MEGARIIIASRQFSHHGLHSGYDQIARHIPGCVVVRPRGFRHGLARRPLGRIPGARFLPRFYALSDLLLEVRLARLAAGGRALVHYLYAEDQLGLGRRLGGLRNTVIVGSVHQPPDWTWYVMNNYRNWEQLDGIVAMSSSQLTHHRERAPQALVRCIPHGVDTEFFTPGEVERSACDVLIVGQWLRDLPAAAEVIRASLNEGLGLSFRFLGRRRDAAPFEGLPVALESDVSDERLRTLYRSARLVWLPLTDATANNAMLEAMACGTAVLAPRLPGLLDYAFWGGVILHEGGIPGALETLRLFTREPGRLDQVRSGARAAAERFSWTRSSEALRTFYREAAESRGHEER